MEETEASESADYVEEVLVDLLTGEERKATDVEHIVQRMIRILAGEYHFPLEAIGRDIPITIETSGRLQRRRTVKADLVVFQPGMTHQLANIERLIVVRKPGTKPSDPKNGIELLKDLLDAIGACKFGLWTNGRDIAYLQKIPGILQPGFVELSDFPGAGERLDDLQRPDRRITRVAVAEDLRETVLRCHDYLYGNQAMTAPRAFAEMLKLIFCKIYDERRLRSQSGNGRQFWVGVTERNDAEGQQRIAVRIKNLFERVKLDPDLRDVAVPSPGY